MMKTKRPPGGVRSGAIAALLLSMGGAAAAAPEAADALHSAKALTQPTVTQQSPWLSAPDTQAQLDAGKVVVQSTLDAPHSRASVDAAVLVHARPEVIWPLITRCASASILVPGLRRCRQLSSAPDGSWDVTEHDIKYNALLPMVHSIYRSDYQAPYRIDFHRVAGDMKDEVGAWVLKPSEDGSSTTIEYRIEVQPGFFVPLGMVRHSLRKRLLHSLLGLRAHAEHPNDPAALEASNRDADAQSAESGAPPQ